MSVYFDHNASSPLHPQVLDAMLPYLKAPVANASILPFSITYPCSAIESARAKIGSLVGARASSVIFTSGGTEANNSILKGFIDYQDPRPIISSVIEHPSILEPLRQLEQAGQTVIYLPVDHNGMIDLNKAEQILSDIEPKLLSVMLANNETGVIQPLKHLARLVSGNDCLIHTDATQMAGKLPIDMADLGVDALTISAHKLQGPQGTGTLITAKKPVQPLVCGGAQEKGRRAGTENVASIVGFGKAAELAALEIEARCHHLVQLRDLFESRLKAISGAVIFGEEANRLPNTTFFSLPYYHGETLLMELDKSGFALASGSACHSEVTQASHVLSAMQVDDSIALNAVRVSMGFDNTLEQVDALIKQLELLISKLPAIIRQTAI